MINYFNVSLLSYRHSEGAERLKNPIDVVGFAPNNTSPGISKKHKFGMRLSLGYNDLCRDAAWSPSGVCCVSTI